MESGASDPTGRPAEVSGRPVPLSGGNAGHPSKADWECFLRGETPRHPATWLVRHLLRGCRVCRERLEPLASLIFSPRSWP